MTQNQNVYSWLQEWYVAQCKDEWEHQYGIKIESQSPGWYVQIDLNETPLEKKHFEAVKEENSEDDKTECYVEAKSFLIYCSSLNLTKGLEIFRHWASN